MRSFRKWTASAAAGCLLLSLCVAPLYSQAAAEQKGPQAKTKAEYDAYMALYSESTPAKKVELAAKFLTDHPETEFKMFVYQMQIDSHARLGNVDKVVETGEKFASDFPQADNNTKKFVMQRMMTSYQQKNDFAKTVEYGDKLLAIDPKDLPSLLTLSSILPERLPTEEDKKAAQLEKALDYSNKALAEINALQKPAQITDEQWTTEKNKLLATVNSSIGLVHLNKKEYDKASEQYEKSTNLTKSNPIDFYRLGIAYTFLARNKAKELNDLVAAMNQAQTELQNAQDAAVKNEKEKKLLEVVRGSRATTASTDTSVSGRAVVIRSCRTPWSRRPAGRRGPGVGAGAPAR
ncbi:MAG: tetratricopeptide repeat protein, partial [Acidobacteria bacterium]|nr:tetratricopeptide repeat protein [Acidobacteriota bacterium]